jgi:lipopolysaccharide export system protein LptA
VRGSSVVGPGFRALVLGPVLATGLSLGGFYAAAQDDVLGAVDTLQPIEITADTLEIEQGLGLAVFSGNVNAVQGDMILRAETLKVYYRTNDASDPEIDAQGRISRIEADGQVHFATPTESARGKLGTYDVEGRTITLTGGVVLTRGDNVLRGNRLELNLATGRSKLFGDGEGGDRVRGLFVPDDTEQ